MSIDYVQRQETMTQATTIDGKAKAAELSTEISAATAELVRSRNIKPGLAVVIIGEDAASQVYVRNKKRTAEAFRCFLLQCI